MPRFVDIDSMQLEIVGKSMEILRQVVIEPSEDLPKVFLYGMLPEKHLNEIRTQVEDNYYDEEDPMPAEAKVTSAAIAIQVSDDQVHYLVTSGLLMDNEEVAFVLDGQIKSTTLFLRNMGKIKFSDLASPVLCEDTAWIDDYLKSKVGGAKKSSSQEKKAMDNSRIVRVLDEFGNQLDDSDVNSIVAMIGKVEEAPDSDQFIGCALGEISKWLIEVKGGPEAGYRYIANKAETDIDEIKENSTLWTKAECLEFLNMLLTDLK